jgi:hypothetical protein
MAASLLPDADGVSMSSWVQWINSSPVPSLSSSVAIFSSSALSTLSSCVDWTDSNLDFDASAASIDRDLNEKLNEKRGIIQLAPELKYQIDNLLDYPSLCMLRATIRGFGYFWSEEDIHWNFLSPFRSIDKMSSMMEKSVGIVKSGSIWANLLNTYTAD